MAQRGRAAQRRLDAVAAQFAGGAGKPKKQKKPEAGVVPPEELLAKLQGEWQDQHGTVIEVADDEAVVHQRGRAKRWPISVRDHTLFFGGSFLALPHDPDAPQWIFDEGPTMTWSRLPTIAEFAERLQPVEDFQKQERDVFFGRRGLQLTHIVLFGDGSADGHEAAVAAMGEAYASYRGRAINIFIDVSVRANAQVIRHFGLLPPGEPGLRLPSQAFPQVRAMDNGADGQKNQQDKPQRRSFDCTVAAHYVEFAEQLGLVADAEEEGSGVGEEGSAAGMAMEDDEEGDEDDLLMEQLVEVALLDTLPIVMLDAILPGQTMRLQIADAPHRAMIASCLEVGLESQGFGMVGIDQRTRVPLMYGTEVRITECSVNTAADVYAAGAASAPISIRVQGYRAFRVEGKPWREEGGGQADAGGYTMARIKWVDFEAPEGAAAGAGAGGGGSGGGGSSSSSNVVTVLEDGDDDEEEEGAAPDAAVAAAADDDDDDVEIDIELLLGGDNDDDDDDDGLDDDDDGLDEEEQLALAIDSEALGPLVETWCHLVRSGGHEKQDGQLDAVIADLGPIPDASLPGTRAVWVGALINPLPGLGVAWEIRPAMLAATSAQERMEVAMAGIEASIENLRGTAGGGT